MTTFTIVLREGEHVSTVNNGQPLVDFLRVFFDVESVVSLTPSVLERLPSLSTTYLFVMLPNTITEELFQKVRYKHLIIGDYHDGVELFWTEKEKSFFSGLTDHYFKMSRLCHTRFVDGMRIGLFPIPIPGIPYRYFGLPPFSLKRRHYPVSFIGYPTHFHGYQQRLEWLDELWESPGVEGGVIPNTLYPTDDIQLPNGPVERLYLKAYMNRHEYLKCLRQTQIALLPTGHSRWTYRHFEAMQYKCIPLSTDVRHIETLIPDWNKTIISVTDHTLIKPIVDEILAHVNDYQERVDEGFQNLNRFLTQGRATSKKSGLCDLFLSQLS